MPPMPPNQTTDHTYGPVRDRASGRTYDSTYDRTTLSARLAYQAAADLRAILAEAGFEPGHDFPSLRGDVTASDEPFVTLGRLNLPAARQLTHLLASIPVSQPQAPTSLPSEPQSQAHAQSRSQSMSMSMSHLCDFENSQLLSMRQRAAASKMLQAVTALRSRVQH